MLSNAHVAFELEEGVALPSRRPLGRVARSAALDAGSRYSPEYKRGYLSAHNRASALSVLARSIEAVRPGRTDFCRGWRDYFREHK